MTPKAELNQMIIVANNTLKRKGYTKIIRLDGKHFTSDDFRISPSMSIKNLIIWLDGFISGLEF
jgi:hypothetical protein